MILTCEACESYYECSFPKQPHNAHYGLKPKGKCRKVRELEREEEK